MLLALLNYMSTCMHMVPFHSSSMGMRRVIVLYLYTAPTSADLADFDVKLKQLLSMGIKEVLHVCLNYYLHFT